MLVSSIKKEVYRPVYRLEKKMFYSRASRFARFLAPASIHADALLFILAMIEGTASPRLLSTLEFLFFHNSHMIRSVRVCASPSVVFLVLK